MLIKGFEHIQHSPVLCKLLEVGKDWISVVSKAADEVEEEERTIRILPKEIGRHSGFVVKIYSTDGADKTTFYAKIQSVSVTTFHIHVLLKNIQCGPDAFHIPLLDTPDGFYLGVITREVKDWSMASTLTRAEQIAFLDEQDRLLSSSFLLNVLNELGRFGNIPNNKENWGFVDCFDNSVAYPQMALIDFSRGGAARRIFESEKRFLENWDECVECIINSWPSPILYHWGADDGQEDKCRLFASLNQSGSILAQAKLFPYLHSPEALTALLQSACDETALWLHEIVQQARYHCVSSTTTNTDTNTSNSSALIAWRYVPRPNTAGLHNQYAASVFDYELLVAEWNVSLQALRGWFPFGNSSDHDSDAGTNNSGMNTIHTQQNDPAGCNDMNDPVMIKQLRADCLSAYHGDYSFIIKPPTMYDRLFEMHSKRRSMSMEVNVCRGDIGEAAEQNVRFANQQPSDTIVGVPIHESHYESNVDESLEATAADQIENTLPRVDKVVHVVSKKRKSKNTGRKKRKRIRKEINIIQFVAQCFLLNK